MAGQRGKRRRSPKGRNGNAKMGIVWTSIFGGRAVGMFPLWHRLLQPVLNDRQQLGIEAAMLDGGSDLAGFKHLSRQAEHQTFIGGSFGFGASHSGFLLPCILPMRYYFATINLLGNY